MLEKYLLDNFLVQKRSELIHSVNEIVCLLFKEENIILYSYSYNKIVTFSDSVTVFENNTVADFIEENMDIQINDECWISIFPHWTEKEFGVSYCCGRIVGNIVFLIIETLDLNCLEKQRVLSIFPDVIRWYYLEKIKNDNKNVYCGHFFEKGFNYSLSEYILGDSLLNPMSLKSEVQKTSVRIDYIFFERNDEVKTEILNYLKSFTKLSRVDFADILINFCQKNFIY